MPAAVEHVAVHEGGLLGAAADGQRVGAVGGGVDQADDLVGALDVEVAGDEVDHVEVVGVGVGGRRPAGLVVEDDARRR